jgi:hypothetical protein
MNAHMNKYCALSWYNQSTINIRCFGLGYIGGLLTAQPMYLQVPYNRGNLMIS